MANLAASCSENLTYDFGMEHGIYNTDGSIPSANIGPEPDLKRLLHQIDGLIVASKLLDKVQPPTSDQSPYIGIANTRPFDELQEELEGIERQTNRTTQEESDARSMPVHTNDFDAESTSAHRSWDMVQRFRTVMQEQWLRGKALAEAAGMQDFFELHSRHLGPGDFRDCALFTLRAVATQSVAFNLNTIFTLESLVYAALKVFNSMEEMLLEYDLLDGINAWVDLVQDARERELFVEFAKRAYPEFRPRPRRMSSQAHTTNTLQAQGYLSQPSMPSNYAYLSPAAAQHPDARSVHSDFGYPSLFPSSPSFQTSSLPARSASGTRNAFNFANSVRFGIAPTLSPFSCLGQDSVEISDYDDDSSQLGGYSTTQLSSTGTVPQIVHRDLNVIQCADTIGSGQNSSTATQTTLFSKALKPLVSFLRYFDETLYRLSGNGITTKKLQSGLSYNDKDQEIAKQNIKGYFLGASEPGAYDQTDMFQVIKSITVQFVDMGLLSTVPETKEFMTCIGKVSVAPFPLIMTSHLPHHKEMILDQPAYTSFRACVLAMLAGSMLPPTPSKTLMNDWRDTASSGSTPVAVNNEARSQGPFICETCGAEFLQKKNYTRHCNQKPHPRPYNKGKRARKSV